MIILISIILFFTTPNTITDSIIRGNVMVSEIGTPLPYVNIGIIGTTIGTVTDANGDFELRIDHLNLENDIYVRFSMIGYYSKTIQIQELMDSDHHQIYLNPREYELDEIAVLSDRLKEKRIGGRSSSTKIVTGWGGKPDGGERGIRMKMSGKPTHIKSLKFHIASNQLDEILMRVNIRSIEDDEPAETLLQQDILYLIENRYTGWVEINLEQYDLIFNQDIAVLLQPVSTSGHCTSQYCLTFSLNMFGYFSSGWLFAKDGSEGDWIVKKNYSPGIHMIVYQ